MNQATDDVNTPSTDGTQDSRASYAPAPEPVESIIEKLLINGFYLKDVPGASWAKDSMKVITPKPATVKALARLLVQAKLEAREEMKKSVSLTILHRVKAKCINKESTEHIQKWAEAKIAALQSQLEGAAGVANAGPSVPPVADGGKGRHSA